MMLTRFAFAALGVASCAAVSWAQPSIQFANLGDGTASLQIVTDTSGSLAAELAVEVQATGDLVLTGATINTTLFDDANPGDNPFIPGVTIGGDTTGLALDLPNNRLFAAYGSSNLGVGAFTYLDLTFEGTVGTLSAFGNVAQLGSNNVVSTSIDLIPEPTSALLAAFGLARLAARRRVA